MENFLGISPIASISWESALLSLLLAFVLSVIIAKIYEITYEGLSWSKSLAQALVLGAIVACLIMMAIGDNLARGIGIIGSLAIIRFRTNLRDPRDMIFVFAALGIGVAAGVQSYPVAFTGTIVFCVVAIALWLQDFGSTRRHDGILRFQLPVNSADRYRVNEILQRETKNFTMIAMRNIQQGEFVDYTYQVKLRKPEYSEKLIAALEEVDKISGLKYLSQHATVEV